MIYVNDSSFGHDSPIRSRMENNGLIIIGQAKKIFHFSFLSHTSKCSLSVFKLIILLDSTFHFLRFYQNQLFWHVNKIPRRFIEKFPNLCYDSTSIKKNYFWKL